MRLPRFYFLKRASRNSYGFFQKALMVGVLVLVAAEGVLLVGTSVVVYEARNSAPVVAASFPLGVDPARKLIVENPAVDDYFAEYVRMEPVTTGSHSSWLGRVLSKLALSRWYQNLASPTGRILVILSGERKEEVAEHFGSILGWDKAERREFIERVASSSPALSEGKFAPHTYVTGRGATPAEAAILVTDRFEADVMSRYSTSTAEIISLKDTLTIASLLEREGKDFTDMRQISGIIWNRLFSGMKLQLDATLQYAKGSKVGEPWWPQVLPADKQIASAFNTYKHSGLPPAPIANPSLDAILAALNPNNTDCMFYFHDARGEFHCSVTYKEHVKLLKEYY